LTQLDPGHKKEEKRRGLSTILAIKEREKRGVD
jgi:hypothetical protein